MFTLMLILFQFVISSNHDDQLITKKINDNIFVNYTGIQRPIYCQPTFWLQIVLITIAIIIYMTCDSYKFKINSVYNINFYD